MADELPKTFTDEVMEAYSEDWKKNADIVIQTVSTALEISPIVVSQMPYVFVMQAYFTAVSTINKAIRDINDA